MDETRQTTDPPVTAVTGSGSGISLLPRWGEHPGFTLWRVSLVLIAGMFAMAILQVRGPVAWTVLTALVCWCVTWVHPLTAVAAGVETWALETGFGVHRFGELSFGREDLVRLAAVVCVVALVAVVTRRRSPFGGSPLEQRERLRRGR